MIALDIRIDVKQAERFYSNLRRNAVKKAAARAINDTLITLRAEGARAIKKQHPALKIGDIKNAMVMHRAFQNYLRGSVDTTGKAQSLLLFRPGGGEVSRRRLGPRGQVSFAARRRFRPVTAVIGTKRSVITYQGRKAFRIAAYGNEVFVRKAGKGRGVRKIRGPSLPGVFRAQRALFQQIANTRWPINFKARMAYEIEQAKR